MIAAAHAVAITCYLLAVVIAALPFARRVGAPVRAVTVVLAVGLLSHGTGLFMLARAGGATAVTGLGPALSFAGFSVAAVLLFAELFARDVSLTLAAAPLAALAATAGNLAGLQPMLAASGGRAAWLTLHILLAFVGLASYATAAAAGTIYLVAHRDLKSHRFGAVFRSFPSLATLDRVNHVAAIAGFLGLTLAIALAATYSIAYRALVFPQILWGTTAWLGVVVLALGRVKGAFTARRAAQISTITFVVVIGMYVIVRLGSANRGQFL